MPTHRSTRAHWFERPAAAVVRGGHRHWLQLVEGPPQREGVTVPLQWFLCDFKTGITAGTVWQSGHAWACYMRGGGLKLSFRPKEHSFLRKVNWE